MYIGKTYRAVQRIGGVVVKLYSGTVTASGDSKTTYLWIPPFISRANLFIEATENSGDHNLNAKVVTMHPRVPGHSDVWYDLQAFTQLTGTGNEKKSLQGGLGDKLAVVWTLSGGSAGNWTFSVYAELKL